MNYKALVLLVFGFVFVSAQVTVDLQLLLMIDDSGSILESAYRLQIGGYVASFNSTEVQDRIILYPDGIAIAVVFWSTRSLSNPTPVVDLVIPWRLLDDFTSIMQFVSDFQTLSLARIPTLNNPLKRFLGWTTIQETLIGPVVNVRNPNVTFPGSLAYFNSSGFTSARKLIDISSDGPNNVLPNGFIINSDAQDLLSPANIAYVTNARDMAQSKDIVINCLAVLSDSGTGLNESLSDYYRDYLITNDPARPGFVVQAANFDDFEAVITGKLIREISGDCFNVRQNVTGGIFLSTRAQSIPTYTIPGGSTFTQARNPSWFDDSQTTAKWLTIQTFHADSICYDFVLDPLVNIDLMSIRFQCASPTAATATLNGVQVAACSPASVLPTDVTQLNSGFESGANSICFNIPASTAQNGIWISFDVDVLRTFECDSIGSWEYSSDCNFCECYSGYYGQCCEMKVGNVSNEGPCNYTPFDNLDSKKNHTTKIDTSATGFNGGMFTISLFGGSVEKTQVNARRTLVSVGLKSLDAVLVPNFPNPEPAEPCRCFTQTSVIGLPGLGSDICGDRWSLTSPWPTIRDKCCSLDFSDPNYLAYDCTIDVAHYDDLAFLGAWRNVTDRGRFSRSPLPLFVRFQRNINLTADIQVFSDLEIKAYISLQEYDPIAGKGYLDIDIVTLWPYTLSLANLTQTENSSFTFTSTFGAISTSGNFQCNNTAGSQCWQILQITVTPHTSNPPVCNLDNTFVVNLTPHCRGVVCPNLLASQANTTIVATFRTENFCPAVVFSFPLNGTLTTYIQSFAFPITSFIAYSYPIDTTKAAKMCIKATVALDVAAVNQGQAATITATYYNSLALLNPNNGLFSIIYDNGVACPALPTECASPTEVALVLDTEFSFGTFSELNVNEAGACFYLTRSAPPLTTIGLVDALDIPWRTFAEPIVLKIVATVGVDYNDNTKKTIEIPSGNPTTFIVGDFLLSDTGYAEGIKSEGSITVAISTILVTILVVFVIFIA